MTMLGICPPETETTCSECREHVPAAEVGTCDGCGKRLCEGCTDVCTGVAGSVCRDCHLVRCTSRDCWDDA